jgi:phosphoserine phosphatase RsbU/P
MTIADGDLIFLSTDGLTDARNSVGEAYGERRLEQLVSGPATANAKDFVLAALDAVTQFAGQAPRFDDLTALALRYHRNTMDPKSR